jgi:cytosine/adenosine deaminase-related metal-dependent hydrolase
MLTLIENVYAVLNDDRGADLDRTDILIEDDHIAAIGQDLRFDSQRALERLAGHRRKAFDCHSRARQRTPALQ